MVDYCHGCGCRLCAGEAQRAYTVSLNLARFDRDDWLTRDETMDTIAGALDHIRKVRVLTPRIVARLLPVDPLAPKAGLLGPNPDFSYLRTAGR